MDPKECVGGDTGNLLLNLDFLMLLNPKKQIRLPEG
jgi:hypothetical protein